MKSVDIRKEKALAQRVRALYKTAFPREEQMIYSLISVKNSLRKFLRLFL